MPYKDAEKRREVQRRSKAQAREQERQAKAAENVDVQTESQVDKPKKDVKKRNWWFVLYPESAPQDWRDILRATGLPGEVSPLHDKDVYSDGEHAGLPKKAHYHVILCYPGPTTYSVVRKLVQDTLGQPIPQPLEAIRGAHRYLTHADNPEKYQYESRDIETFNGFSILDHMDMSASESLSINRELVSLIMEMEIADYCDFVEYLLWNGTDVQYEYAISHTIFFSSYLRSRWQREKAIREAEERRVQEQNDLKRQAATD